MVSGVAPDLLGDILHMLSNQWITAWVEQHREAPGIPKGDQMRFSWVELDVQHAKQCDLFSCDLALVYPVSQGGV